MDNTIKVSAGHTAPVRTQEITMPEVNVQREMRRQREGNPDLEQRVRNLVGDGSGTRTASQRTTVHGAAPRNNHR